MDELITRQGAIEAIARDIPFITFTEDPKRTAQRIIGTVPSADAVEVVRCKNCKFSDVYQSDSRGATAMYCRAFTFHRMVAEDDYCSYGERREP